MDTKIKYTDWDNKSNKKIKEELESLKHEHISLKDKILKLMEHLNEIEKEHEYGNSILNKRYKGEE